MRKPSQSEAPTRRRALQVEVRRSDVQSAWSGLRPLAMDPNAADTASASRDHIVTQDPDGLITVTGGFRHALSNPQQPRESTFLVGLAAHAFFRKACGKGLLLHRGTLHTCA